MLNIMIPFHFYLIKLHCDFCGFYSDYFNLRKYFQFTGEIPWNFGKRETKFLDEFGVDGDALEQIFNEQSVER